MKKITNKLMSSYIILIFVTLLVVGIFLSFMVDKFVLQNKEKELIDQGRDLALIFQDMVERGVKDEHLRYLEALDRSLNAHLWVIDHRGVVMASSLELPRRGGAPLRITDLGPTFSGVLEGKEIRELAEHPVYRIPMLLVAIPFKKGEEVVGGVFLQAPVSILKETTAELQKLILGSGIMATFLAIVFSFYLTRVLGNPLQEINTAARQMAQGNFEYRLQIKSQDEVGELGNNLNYLASSLKSTLTELNKEKDTLNSTISSISEGVLAVDGKGRIFLSNEPARRLLRYTGDDLQGKHLEETDLPEEVVRIFMGVLQGQPSQPHTITILPKKPLTIYPSAIKDEGGVMGVVGLIHDISALDRLENVHRNFIASASHELRRPLTAIKGFIEAIADGAVEKNEQDRYLKIIRKETDALEGLLSELLDFSRLEEEIQGIEKRLLDISQPVSYAVAEMWLQARLKDVKVNKIIAPDLPPVAGDAEKLEHAVANLIDNAIKFSPPGSSIDVGVVVKDGFVCISVRDHGPGLKEEEVDYLWEKFVKGREAQERQLPGSGLGLSIVKTIVEAHGGRIEASNAPEGGAQFKMCIPHIDNK